MDQLIAVILRLNQLDKDTAAGSNFSRLTEIASFMDDLPDIVTQLEQARIEWEDQDLTRYNGNN